MKASYKTIGKFVDLSGLTPELVSERLTFAGVEVESVSYLARGTNLAIGHVISCLPHPDSNHLHVLQVDLGNEIGIHQIVCGAPNAREGLNVIVAMVGAVLPNVTIQKSVIRGVESDGMCCSLLELGVERKYLSESQAGGIEELPPDAPVGETDVLGYLGLDDVILDLKVLANRPDLLSIVNIAREISGLFGLPFTAPKASSLKEVPTDFSVSSDTPDCPSFSVKVVRGIHNGESPVWMKSALMAMSVRSIDLLVDIGNYYMLLTGQPLNVYDLDKLEGHSLKATTGYEGKLVAMDDKEYQLEHGDMLIMDGDRPVCLGGLMTARDAMVSDSTENVAIEAASFKGSTIRHTSQRLGLASESSTRFVKGTDHFQEGEVLELVASALVELGGASIVETTAAYQSETRKEQSIPYSADRINSILATDFSAEEVDKALNAFGFITKDGNAIVPDYRLDVNGLNDLAEEVIRYYGSSRVDSRLPSFSASLGGMKPERQKERLVSSTLRSLGLDECLSYTLVPLAWTRRFSYLGEHEAIKIMNPLTEDHEYLRTNLLPSLLDVADYNVSRKQNDTSLFEISDIYASGYRSTRLAVVLTGAKSLQGHMSSYENGYFRLKGILESILSLFGIEPNRYRFERLKADKDEFHPGRSATLRLGKDVVAVLGELHPLARKELGFESVPVSGMEIDLGILLATRTGKTKFSDISRFPSVNRDLAFILRKDIASNDVLSEVKRAGGGLVRSVEVFDVFSGKVIDIGMKSMAITISYGLGDRTLTDKDVSEAEGKIKEALLKKFNAVLRG